MAYTTAVLLIVLVFVGVPLQVAGHPGVARVVGTLHGFLYLVYLVVAFELTRRLHIPIGRTLLVLIAGTVPFGAIIAERRLTSEYSRQERRAAKGTAGTAPQEI
jgi:integral membrane protein